MNDSSNSDPLRLIFETASDMERHERAAYLDSACLDHPALRQEVDSLFHALEGAGDFLKDPSINPTSAFTAAVELNEGDIIDQYRILEKIGEGSNAVVFMVEQIETLRRRAAMKVIRLGMDTREVIARFEAERQALAMMDHPNIAKVFDAGTTHTGRPYFIMELVKGIPITDYCDRNLLSTNERLELFIQICLALQHAHLKGIIHRDVKPSNVLVTLHDGIPVPKVIDFGIAKATESKLTDKTLFTRFHQFIGTPAYMSPEQAEMSGLDIDTRSDIYSLGVLLYELLSGSTPFDGKELLESGYAGIQKTIREKVPESPSTRVNTLRGEGLTAVAKNRRIESGDLSKNIKGDLDWIVMKALEKDRTRRYESATELARDIRRHLADEPVKASPPSKIYSARKLLRRHRAAAIAVGAIALSLLIGLLIAGAMWRRSIHDAAEARRQAEKANAVTGLLDSMFLSAGPDAAKGDGFTVRDLLNDYSREFAGRDDLDPEVEMTVRHTVATAYDGLGDYVQAELHAQRAYDLSVKISGAESPGSMQTLSHLGWIICQLGGIEKGQSKLLAAASWQNDHLEKNHPKYQLTLCYLAEIYYKQNELTQARELAQQVLDTTQPNASGDAGTLHLWATKTLANVYRVQGQTQKADDLLRSFISKSSQDESFAQHPRTIEAMHTACRLQIDLGNLSEAEKLASSGYDMARRILSGKHRTSLLLLGDLAQLDFLNGRFTEAQTRWEEVLREQRQTQGEQQQDTIQTMLSLAELEAACNRLPEAESLTKQANHNASGTFGSGDPITIESLSRLAKIISDQGRLFEARQIFQRVHNLAEESLGKGNETTLRCASRLANFEEKHGNAHDADALHREIIAQYQLLQGDTGELTLGANFAYTRFLKNTGRYAEALDLGNRVLERHQANKSEAVENEIAILRELASIQKLREVEVESLRFLDAALVLAHKHPDTLKVVTLKLMREHAEINGLLMNPKVALATLNESLAIATASLPEDDPLLLEIKTDQAVAAQHMAELAQEVVKAKIGYFKAVTSTDSSGIDLPGETNRLIERLIEFPDAAEECEKLIGTNIESSLKLRNENELQYFRALHLRAKYFQFRGQYDLAHQYYQEVIEAQYAAGWERTQRTHTSLFIWWELLTQLNRLSEADAILDSWQDKLTQSEWPKDHVDLLVPRRDLWSYRRFFKNQNTLWRNTSTLELPTNWNQGRAPFGYGIRGIGTMPLTDGDKRAYYTTCFHREFQVTDPGTYESIKVRLRRENGASIFINGKEVLRSNLHETAIGGTGALSGGLSIDRNVHHVYLIPPSFLKKGINIVTAELYQNGIEGSHMAFDLAIEALRKNPQQ